MKSKALMFALMAFAFAAQGFAASDIVYVSYNGLDTRPCTRVAPCKTITHALTVVNAGGQVIIVGSGTYDVFTITKAVTVAAEPGAIAALDVPGSSTGIVINAGANDRVVIRGMYLNGGGLGSQTSGILVSSAAEVSLENVVARNFDSIALEIQPTVASFISVEGGVYSMAPLGASSANDVFPAAITTCCTDDIGVVVPPIVAVDGAAVEDGCYAILVNAAMFTLTNSVLTSGATNNANCNQQAGSTIGVLAESLVSTIAVIENNVISDFDQGVQVNDSGSFAYVSANTITGNIEGVQWAFGGAALTRGNNTIVANAENVAGTMTPFSGQ